MECWNCGNEYCEMKKLENASVLRCFYCEFAAEPISIYCTNCLKGNGCGFVRREYK